MTIRELTDADLMVIEPGKRLTLANAQELISAVQSLPRGVAPTIVVNMEHVEVVDSAGIGSMVKAEVHSGHWGNILPRESAAGNSPDVSDDEPAPGV